MDIQSVIKDLHYKVLVSCMTYNQSRYIEDALNGFAMQQTSFPFVCLVMDDASTDGEQEVINAFLEKECEMMYSQRYETDESQIVIVPHKHNSNCSFIVYYLKKNLYCTPRKRQLVDFWRGNCKYVAFCEGDDYWTESQKLQIQVDFLDSHPEYSMCFHNAIEHWEDGRIPDKYFSLIEDRDYFATDFHGHWIIPTASTCMRSSVLLSDFYKKLVDNSVLLWGDAKVFVSCYHYGKIRGMSFVGSVYRRMDSGAAISAYFEKDHMLASCLSSYEEYYNYGKEFQHYSSRSFYKMATRLVMSRNIAKDVKKDLLKKCWTISPWRTIWEFLILYPGELRLYIKRNCHKLVQC